MIRKVPLKNKLLIPRTLKQSILIAGILTTGGLFVCCLSGVVGQFNNYTAIGFAIAACGFFLLLACLTGLSLLHKHRHMRHKEGLQLPGSPGCPDLC